MLTTLTPSIQIYIFLIILLAILGALNAFLPQGNYAGTIPDQQMPASKPVMAVVTAGLMLVVYGGLGYLGLRLAMNLGFPDIWDENVSIFQRLVIPALVGVGVGIFFILVDSFFKKLHAFGALPHPPFPTSVVASGVAGIGEEVFFRLFFIPFWMWLISKVVFQGNCPEGVFWGVAIFSAVVFSAAHLPAVMYLVNVQSINQIPPILMAEIFILNSVVSLAAAFFFRKFGFLAAVSVHLWTDLVWHVLWGLLI